LIIQSITELRINYVHWGFWTLFFHETPFPLNCGLQDTTEKRSCSKTFGLNGKNMTLKDLEYGYEENTY